MNRQEFFNEWADALESGDYVQGRGKLHRTSPEEFCCLGVACDLLHKKGLLKRFEDENIAYGEEQNYNYLPVEAQRLMGVNYSVFTNDLYSLARLNDEGASFSEIAQIIRSGQLQVICESGAE